MARVGVAVTAPYLSLLFDPRILLAFRKCETSHGSWGWVTMLVNVVVFTPSDAPGVNSHRDGGGQGRNPGNCHCFSTLRLSWCLKSVNSDTDRGARGHDPCNCRCFQTLGGCWILKNVNSHRDCLDMANHASPRSVGDGICCQSCFMSRSVGLTLSRKVGCENAIQRLPVECLSNSRPP